MTPFVSVKPVCFGQLVVGFARCLVLRTVEVGDGWGDFGGVVFVFGVHGEAVVRHGDGLGLVAVVVVRWAVLWALGIRQVLDPIKLITVMINARWFIILSK